MRLLMNPGKKTWAIIPQNTTWLTYISMSAHIMFTQTSLQHFSCGPSSPAFGEGVLKSLGFPTPRSPHYHIWGPSLICLSPQVSLATKYLASWKYSIEHHFHTVSLEEHQQSSTHNSREHYIAVTFLLSSLDREGCGSGAVVLWWYQQQQQQQQRRCEWGQMVLNKQTLLII